jgi:hypothetical protein
LQQTFNASPGDTLLFKHFFEPTEHLWVVLLPPTGDPRQTVIVNLTSRRPGADTTVVLSSSDHPFVVAETVVNYKDARLALVDDLKQRVEDGVATPHSPFEPQVLRRIQDGVQRSRFTPRGIKRYCAAVL